MAVKLRLRRMGKKKQPIYKIVAANSRAPRDGKFLDAIGMYNPKTDPATIEVDVDKALDWLRKGAQPTDTVRSLLSKKGVLMKKDLLNQGLSEDEVNTKLSEWNRLNEEKLAKKAKEKPAPKAAAKTEEEKSADQPEAAQE